jgi:hypothetical protein
LDFVPGAVTADDVGDDGRSRRVKFVEARWKLPHWDGGCSGNRAVLDLAWIANVDELQAVDVVAPDVELWGCQT